MRYSFASPPSSRREARSKTLEGTRLLLARHAETAAPDRFHGAESDIGLSAWGARQAELLGQSLADLGSGRALLARQCAGRSTRPLAIGRACDARARRDHRSARAQDRSLERPVARRRLGNLRGQQGALDRRRPRTHSPWRRILCRHPPPRGSAPRANWSPAISAKPSSSSPTAW